MSAIEFSAQAGKTFSVQLYQLDGTPIGSPIAGVTDAGVPTQYRTSTGATTGTVYVVATATNLRVTGYANLDKPAASGCSPLSNLTDLDIRADTMAIRAKAELAAAVLANKHNVTANPNGTYTIAVRDEADAVTLRTIVYNPLTGERTVS